MLCSLVKNAEHGAIQDEAERMYVLEETVLCMVESLHFLRKLCNVVRSETGEAHLRNRSECTLCWAKRYSVGVLRTVAVSSRIYE